MLLCVVEKAMFLFMCFCFHRREFNFEGRPGGFREFKNPRDLLLEVQFQDSPRLARSQKGHMGFGSKNVIPRARPRLTMKRKVL